MSIEERRGKQLSRVEQCARKNQWGGETCEGEKIPVIVVETFPKLGRLTALRFIEWVQQNPEGVISLPTGRTPEHFIAWTRRFIETWDEPSTRRLLEENGVDPARRPTLSMLRFVQIDEFYPMDPRQHNSFYFYVNKYYINGFGLDPERCLLIDCTAFGIPRGHTLADIWPDGRVDLSLRLRKPTNRLESLQKDTLCRVDDWCRQREEEIRALGGIGFFLGGIGPDGHVGFNVAGSDHFSTTRLTETNYETQAAAATDLGGIEVARRRLVITIGLGTIRYNPECTAIIMAAGEAKARVVSDAVRGPCSNAIPASALRVLPNASFYVTRGAARLLRERRATVLSVTSTVEATEAAEVVIDTALRRQKRLTELEAADFCGEVLAEAFVRRVGEKLPAIISETRDRLEKALLNGVQPLQGLRFLHTEPHHDDIMLGYLPAVVRAIRSATNTHVFATLTSGFTAVTNDYMRERFSLVEQALADPAVEALFAEGYFSPDNRQARNRDVWQYLDGVAARDQRMRNEGTARRALRDLVEVYGDSSPVGVRRRVEDLTDYFRNAYPGMKDRPDVQRLKGMCREWEAECLWGYFGWNTENVRHLRLGFYTGDLFTPEPTMERDVIPIVKLLAEVNPDIVTVALDPEASGPDTHYKVLQAIAEALRVHSQATGRRDIRIWGYRNVWYRFHPAEVNLMVPVSLNMFSIMNSAFMECFVSQRGASFPSHEYDGPFCELAQQIQCEQYQKLKICMGREWFYDNPNPLIRATRGLVFLKELTLSELYAHCRAIRRVAEAL